MDPGAIFVLVAGVGVLGWSLVGARRYEARVTAAWSAAAERLGGTYLPATRGFLRRSGRRIEATIAGVAITVDTHVVSTGKSSSTFTRWRARAPLAFALELHVLPHGFLRDLSVKLGAQDLELGDPGFDRQWVVKGNRPALVRELLDAEARGAMPALSAGVTPEAGGLRTSQRGLVTDVELLTRLARALAVVAGWPQRLLARWHAMAVTLGLEPEEQHDLPRLHGTIGSRDVEIVAGLDDDVSTVVRMALRHTSAQPLQATSAEALLPAARPAFAACRPLRVARLAQVVEVALPGLGAEAGRITAALALCEQLADDGGPAYR
jgi:hypothetical protein